MIIWFFLLLATRRKKKRNRKDSHRDRLIERAWVEERYMKRKRGKRNGDDGEEQKSKRE